MIGQTTTPGPRKLSRSVSLVSPGASSVVSSGSSTTATVSEKVQDMGQSRTLTQPHGSGMSSVTAFVSSGGGTKSVSQLLRYAASTASSSQSSVLTGRHGDNKKSFLSQVTVPGPTKSTPAVQVSGQSFSSRQLHVRGITTREWFDGGVYSNAQACRLEHSSGGTAKAGAQGLAT